MSGNHDCKHCGTPITTVQARYCSDACRMRAYRKRKKALKIIVTRAIETMTKLKRSTGQLINANDLQNVVDIDDVRAWSDSMQKRLKPR